MLVEYFRDAGTVIVYAVVGQGAVALGHVHHADPVGKAADAQGRHPVVHISQLLELHFPKVIQAVVDPDVLKNLPCHRVQAPV